MIRYDVPWLGMLRCGNSGKLQYDEVYAEYGIYAYGNW